MDSLIILNTSFSQLQSIQYHDLKKKNVFNSYISEKVFHEGSLDIDMICQRSRCNVGLFIIWTLSVEIFKNLFCNTFKRS